MIVEAFLPGTEPTQRAVLTAADSQDGGLEAGAVPFEGLGAVY